eukprot:3774605-Pleurochrysis_carterae.AAC.2
MPTTHRSAGVQSVHTSAFFCTYNGVPAESRGLCPSTASAESCCSITKTLANDTIAVTTVATDSKRHGASVITARPRLNSPMCTSRGSVDDVPNIIAWTISKSAHELK